MNIIASPAAPPIGDEQHEEDGDDDGKESSSPGHQVVEVDVERVARRPAGRVLREQVWVGLKRENQMKMWC